MEPDGESADEQTLFDCDVVVGSCVNDEHVVEIVVDEVDLLLGQHEHKLGKPSNNNRRKKSSINQKKIMKSIKIS